MDGTILEGKVATFYCKGYKTVNLLHENSLYWKLISTLACPF